MKLHSPRAYQTKIDDLQKQIAVLQGLQKKAQQRRLKKLRSLSPEKPLAPTETIYFHFTRGTDCRDKSGFGTYATKEIIDEMLKELDGILYSHPEVPFEIKGGIVYIGDRISYAWDPTLIEVIKDAMDKYNILNWLNEADREEYLRSPTNISKYMKIAQANKKECGVA